MPSILETFGLVSRPVVPSAVSLRFRTGDRLRLEVEVRDHETKELIDVMLIRDAADWLKELNYRPILGAQAVFLREAQP